ncbi:DUF4238 domain-containing protein [Oxalobacteraceae bacterium CAVE-383]|nr:DUF4238 domain-containing protein [Oxalobacteraceae bacterium CAVE-383]
MNDKKRHHFVPKAYLKAFTNGKGRVHVYRKDEPGTVLTVSPDGTGFERYYYSQPTPEEGTDHNRLEDMFSGIEGKWPQIVERIGKGENVNDVLPEIFEFIILQRVRVPASRDATEARLRGQVKSVFRDLLAKGFLPPPPASLRGRLDDVVVSIDPHKSIHGMVEDIQAAKAVFERIGLSAVRNNTSIPFLTSDNPVTWFDPSKPSEDIEPYGISKRDPVLLLFPISPSLLILGATDYMNIFARHGLQHSETREINWVKQINEQICRFAYKAVYASALGQEEMIVRHAGKSPVWEQTGAKGKLVFGERSTKLKWQK